MKFPNAKAEVQIPAIKAYKSSAVTERFSRADFCAPENEATNNAAVPMPERQRPEIVTSYIGCKV